MAAGVREIDYRASYAAGDTSGPDGGGSFTADTVFRLPGGKIGLTAEGGLAILLMNKTGGNSVKGMVVEAGAAVADSFTSTGADDNHPIGIVYEAGIADGSLCWVVFQGRCQVLLGSATAGTMGYWVRTHQTEAGRAEMATAPAGGTVGALETHMAEIGHSLQTVAAGNLCYIMCHFN